METKQEILDRLGKKDGFDEKRWLTACNISQEKDIHVNFCFESLISLEEKGLIQASSNSLEGLEYLLTNDPKGCSELSEQLLQLAKALGRESDVFVLDFTPPEKSQSIKIEPQNI